MPYNFPGSRKLYWKPQELARALRLTSAYIYQLIREFGLPHVQVFDSVWVPHSEARAWFRRRRGGRGYADAMRVR